MPEIYNYEKKEIFSKEENINDDYEFDKTKQELLSKCDILIIIVTLSALNRRNTQREIEDAKKANKKIIACFLKDVNYTHIQDNWNLVNVEKIEFDDPGELISKLSLSITIYLL